MSSYCASVLAVSLSGAPPDVGDSAGAAVPAGAGGAGADAPGDACPVSAGAGGAVADAPGDACPVSVGGGGAIDDGGGGTVDGCGDVGGAVDVGMGLTTAKLTLVPPQSLVLVTVCSPSAASPGTVNVSETLPRSSG